jgi:3'-5' exoribonuclease
MRETAKELSSPFYQLCLKVLDDPRFLTTYGSAGQHHAYEGGLIVHTAEVLETSFHLSNIYRAADREVLTVAAIYHDYMKIKEYLPEVQGIGVYSNGVPVKFGKTPYRNLVRHVAGSHAEFIKNLAKFTETLPVDNGEFENKVLNIEHCLLSHHGRLEWGSPVEPQTVEANILHMADMLSMQFGNGK